MSLILGSMLIVSSTSVFASSSDSQISQSQIIQAVENMLPTTGYGDKWIEGKIEIKKELYNPDDTLFGYYIIIKKDQENIGYMIVSANKETEPILEYGEGTDYDYLNGDSTKRFYYLGAMRIVQANNKDELEKIFENIKQKELENIKEQVDKTKDSKSKESYIKELKKLEQKKLKGIEKNKENEKKWEKYLSQSSENNTNSLVTPLGGTTTYKVLNVAHMYQRQPGVYNEGKSACGPTSGAVIADYYKLRGYNVRGVSYYGTQVKLINHLYTEMGTGTIGTTMDQWATGMSTHMNHNASAWDVFTHEAIGYFPTYESYIDANRPVGIRFDYNPWNTDYKWHFVVGVGYNTETGQIQVCDVDSTSTKYRWISWSANDQDMDLGFVSYNP